jgi:hypothetical protein
LLGPELQILVVGTLLNFSGTGRNRFAAAAVGARQTPVTGLENEIG